MSEHSENLFETGDHQPFDEPMELGAILTFAGKDGRLCRIEVRHLIEAFLALDRQGIIPDPGDIWRVRFESLKAATRDFTAPGLAAYQGLEPVTAGICECCQAECHAVFMAGDDVFRIERWAVVTAVMVLIRQAMLPELPGDWYDALHLRYRRILATGRHHCRKGQEVRRDE